MNPPKTPLTNRLVALSEAVTAAKQRERECEQAHRRAQADVARLRDAVLDGYAAGDEGKAAKASRERDKLEAGGVRDSDERLEGARRAAQRAEVERGTFAAASISGLIAERQRDAQAAARAVEQVVEQLGASYAAWNAVYGEVSALLRLAGQHTGSMPVFPSTLEQLVRDARRIGAVTVPPPLPRAHEAAKATVDAA